ncbi:MAG TPA: hypothetical protein VIG47_05180, partial [Gemmatimonadaceae bacterium]
TQVFRPLAPARTERSHLSTWQRSTVGGAVVLALALAGFAGWRAMRSHSAGLAGPDPRRLAVLYFSDESSGKNLGYLTTGLTEGLIDRLSAIPELQVTSRNGSALFQNKDVPADSIARALGVGTLVEGSVEQHGNDVSVSVRLKDATGTDFQRETFEAAASNPLALRDTLAERVAQFLRKRLGQEVNLRDERAGTSNPDAWAIVQQAKLLSRNGDRAKSASDTAGMLSSFAQADSALIRAGALDPRWPTIPTMRGVIAYQASRFYAGDQIRANKWVDKGLVDANDALQLAPQDADALELRGTLQYWRWLMASEPDPVKAKALLDASRKDLETATQISPNQPGAWAVLSHLYYQYNDVVSAKLAARRAYDEDAYLTNADVIVWRLFTSSYDLEQFPDAIHWCDVGSRRFPDNSRFVECKLWLMNTDAVKPDVAAAWRLSDSLVKLAAAPSKPFVKLNATALVAAVIARAGLKDSTEHVLANIDDRADVDPILDVTQTKAFVWTLLGNKEKAIQALALYL